MFRAFTGETFEKKEERERNLFLCNTQGYTRTINRRGHVQHNTVTISVQK